MTYKKKGELESFEQEGFHFDIAVVFIFYTTLAFLFWYIWILYKVYMYVVYVFLCAVTTGLREVKKEKGLAWRDELPRGKGWYQNLKKVVDDIE